MQLILRFKWRNLLSLVVISTEVHRNSLIKYTKKIKVAACNLDRFKKPMMAILIHISPIINSTVSTIRDSLLLKCMVQETLGPLILVSWTSPTYNLDQVLRMFKDHRIVNNLLKIPIVFTTIIIPTAPEMVIVIIVRVAWVVNKLRLQFLDRIVQLVLIMTNIT